MTLDLFNLGPPQWDGDGRDPLDRYYTPEWATEELVKYMGGRIHGEVWEPCCGADMIGRVLRRSCDDVHAYLGTDVDSGADTGLWLRSRSGWHKSEGPIAHDMLGERTHEYFDAIITNPPYTIPYKNGKATAADFARRALEYQGRLGCLVAMLLRLTWLEPTQEREDLFREHPPTDVLILRRVQFIRSDIQNMCTSAWIIWDPAREGQQTVRWAV